LWDSPTAANASDLIWGQQQNVTLQSNGVFNVILGAAGGSPIPGTTPQVNNLAYAFNGSNCFLGVTVAFSNAVAIGNPSEILPRQQLLSVPYAFSAATASTAGTATNATLAASVIPGSITTASLTPGLIQTANIAAGAVTLNSLAARPVGTNVGVGGLAMSVSSGPYPTSTTKGLIVTITTIGRPVFIDLVPDGSTLLTRIGAGSNTGSYGETDFSVLRDNSVIGTFQLDIGTGAVYVPSGAINMIDIPPPGTHTYSIQSVISAGTTQGAAIYSSVLIVYEL
jgi:hypothetical protein